MGDYRGGHGSKERARLCTYKLLGKAPSPQAVLLIDGDLYLYRARAAQKKRSTGVTTSGH